MYITFVFDESDFFVKKPQNHLILDFSLTELTESIFTT